MALLARTWGSWLKCTYCAYMFTRVTHFHTPTTVHELTLAHLVTHRALRVNQIWKVNPDTEMMFYLRIFHRTIFRGVLFLYVKLVQSGAYFLTHSLTLPVGILFGTLQHISTRYATNDFDGPPAMPASPAC